MSSGVQREGASKAAKNDGQTHRLPYSLTANHLEEEKIVKTGAERICFSNYDESSIGGLLNRRCIVIIASARWDRIGYLIFSSHAWQIGAPIRHQAQDG